MVLEIEVEVGLGVEVEVEVALHPQVSEVTGMNVTWEVAREEERGKGWFACSLVQCHLNGGCRTSPVHRGAGECLVQAAGGRVESMACTCSHPVGDTTTTRSAWCCWCW